VPATWTENDRWLFAEGLHLQLAEHLGCHLEGDEATFRVWAPNAAEVALIGDFNRWDPAAEPMKLDEASGVWEAQLGGIQQGMAYKYRVASRLRGRVVDKADPFAFTAEHPPATASVTWSGDYDWADGEWMRNRADRRSPQAPISIYELHLGSWRRPAGYRVLAPKIADYVADLGFTHVELLPVMEHPFYGSWGYQCTGYFAATSRYGKPEDLMYLIDHLHQRGIGVVLDWVPSHFPADEHGLEMFDGTHLYEHADPRLGRHPDWDSLIFNYDRPQVRSFLLSSADYWLRDFHADGLRVDAVASMLYLDYSRDDGAWVPNRYGGRENLGAIELLTRLNQSVDLHHPGVMVIAEESTAWPGVTRPVSEAGLGFAYKWDLGWMNDTLRYMALDPLFRSHSANHQLLTFRGMYALAERFLLPLSHDEVVHGKRSLLGKQVGEGDTRYAALRLLFGFQWSTPGKKLLFMGGEIAQPYEWNHDGDMDWEGLADPGPAGVQAWVSALNALYSVEPALHAGDHSTDGFHWLEPDDSNHSTLSYFRAAEGARPVMVVANFTPVAWHDYRVGAPRAGEWAVALSSDDLAFGGSGIGTLGPMQTEAEPMHGQQQSLVLQIAPLSISFMVPMDPR
jgi:1,4-alpha-glucan branching enzyme